MTFDTQKTSQIALTPEGRRAVSEQLELLLGSALFKQSRRYSPFLRYVVEKTLAGESDTLKERTLGIEIFGRAPDYDSSNDPVVRVTAGEVRKRIAQYYHEPGHDQELRIELSPGSYVPEFLPAAMQRPELEESVSTIESVAATAQAQPIRRPNRLLWALVASVLVLGLVAYIVRWQTQRSSVVDQWWYPALHSTSPVLLSVGTISGSAVSTSLSPATRSASDAGTVGSELATTDHVGLVDAIALETFASLFATRNQTYRTLSASGTTYDDMRSAPVVLIAGLDNVWTMRVTEPLRFHFELLPNTQVAIIADQQRPANTDWRVDFATTYSQLTRDYAIIARLHDATSDKPVFVIAGIGRNGTTAAAEYVTTESTLKALLAQLPAHWEDKNVEAVIQTRVINGQAGPPILVQVQVW